MWSVWSETVDVHLGQGFCLLKVGRSATQLMRYPATLALDHVLDRLTQALKQISRRKHKLRITLSSALCPAFTFHTPPGINRYSELHQIAQASAAELLGVAADSLHCEIDISHTGIAAAVPQTLITTIKDWTGAQRNYISSIRPLWSVATQCPRVRAPSCSGLWLQEPDALTVLSPTASSQTASCTWAFTDDSLIASMAARRYLIGVGSSEDALVKLSFSTQAHKVLAQGPSLWTAYWSSP